MRPNRGWGPRGDHAALSSPRAACGSIALPNCRRGMNRQIRVVIVDDEKPARARLITLLERQPAVQVTAACSGGQEALEAVSTAARSGTPVDVIFLDVQMPEMDGFAMLEALAAAGARDSPPRRCRIAGG